MNSAPVLHSHNANSRGAKAKVAHTLRTVLPRCAADVRCWIRTIWDCGRLSGTAYGEPSGRRASGDETPKKSFCAVALVQGREVSGPAFLRNKSLPFKNNLQIQIATNIAAVCVVSATIQK